MNAVLASPSPITELPLSARRLGNAGLIPFVVGAALVWLVWPEAHPYTTLALSAYAAVIVSFLGGIHWGIAFRATAAGSTSPSAPGSATGAATGSPASGEPTSMLFVWGIVPSLVAWIAVMMPPSAGLVIHALMLIACYLVDRRVYPAHGLQAWLTLRFRLSAVAALSCLIGAAGT